MSHATAIRPFFHLLLSVALLFSVTVFSFPYYQPSAPTAFIVFVLFAIIAALRPYAGLILWLAVVPWLSMAKWTGAMVVEEFDLALWGYAIGLCGYLWRLGYMPTHNIRWHPLLLVLLLLALGWQLMALVKGYQLLPAPASTFFTNYEDNNGPVRIGKALFSALCFYLCCRVLSADWPRFQRALTDGFALGAAAVLIGCIYERFFFTGLLNLSTDYRTTSWFWEMHTGGATLDAYLALCLPFLLQGLIYNTDVIKKLAYAVLLSAYGYVALTTFSRGVYIALPLLVVLFTALHFAANRKRGLNLTISLANKRRLVVMLAIMLLCTVAAVALFDVGGYRLLLAVSGFMLLLLVAISQAPFRCTAVLLGSSLAVLAAGLLFLTIGVGKIVYIVYSLCWFAAAVLLVFRSKRQPDWLVDAFSTVLLTTLALLAAAIAWYWSDYRLNAAHFPALMLLPATVLSLLIPLPVAAALPQTRLIRPAQIMAATVWAAGSALSLLLVMFLNSSYIDSRFATTDRDLSGRFEHWQKALAAMEHDADFWLGSGVGRFVSLNRQRGETDDQVAILTLLPLTSGNALYLKSGEHIHGYGEVFRLTQQIDAPVGKINLQLALRHNKRVSLLAEICSKQLLYHGKCARGSITLKHAKQGVTRVTLPLEDSPFAQDGNLLSKTFSLAVQSRDTEIVLESLQLSDSHSDNLLHNSQFDNGMQGWFFSSDRHHMPYHVKGLWPMQWFEMGLIGLLLWSLLTLVIIAAQLLPGRRFSLAGSACALALTGMLLVGLFDSVIDGGRMAMLYFSFILLCGSIRPHATAPRFSL